MSSNTVIHRFGLLLICLSSILAVKTSNAQATPQNTKPGGSVALDLLSQFKNSPPGSLKNQEMLIGALNGGVPKTDENYFIIRDSLNKSKVPAEKVLLLKLAASMHTPKDRSQRNLSIETDIKSAINSSDSDVAREAVFEYSRLGYTPDRHQLLKSARDSRVISSEDYYGELAHGVRFAPGIEQESILNEISSSRLQFPVEILADMFSDGKFLNQLSPNAKQRLVDLLAKSEPSFPLALDNFGLVDAIRFANWLNALASIQSNLTGSSFSDIATARLQDPKIDPRKILAVFIDSSGRRIVSETTDKVRLQKLLQIGQQYSDSLPQNNMLHEATASFSNLLSAKR